MNTTKMRTIALATLIGCFGASTGAIAADTDKEARMKRWTESKDQLEKELGTGKDKAHYRQTLEKMGYAITAVNYDEPDYLEYEVIKGLDSYEVQVDFENGVADNVDVTTNVWKTEATRAALKDKDYKYVYPATITADAEKYSDRTRAKAWAGGKDALEKELGVGHDRSHYRGALEKMGYQVTSVNDNEADHLEMEVVKGDTSYEVKVDFDEKTKKSTDVDVAPNIWETEATEKAKGDE